MMAQVGDTMKFDFQSDVFEGEYRLVEDLGNGQFVAEYLEPSDELIDAVLDYYLNTPVERICLGWVDPFGPGRRPATPQETADQEIMKRIDDAGRRFKIEIVSTQRWNEMF